VNKEQKAAVVDEIAGQIKEAQAIFAIDYRGVSVTQAAELRGRLDEAGATFRVVKNTLTERAADKAGADALKELLDGPTAFTFVSGDAALAAKALAQFRRQNNVLEFKGGILDGAELSVEQIESIARLPGLDVLRGQFVGVLASPITGLVRGLGSLIGGLAVALGQIREQGLDGGEGSPQEETASEAPGDPVAEAEAVEEAAGDEDSGEEAAGEEVSGEEGSDQPPSDSDEAKEG
jgi:large subunit ribosomal protein L10